jgi:site-specific recombinase XerD
LSSSSSTNSTTCVLRVTGKGIKVVLVPLPPAVNRAIDHAVADRVSGPILRNTRDRQMDRHTATRRLQQLAAATGFAMPHLHPHMLRHTHVTTMLDAGAYAAPQTSTRHSTDRRRSK